MNQADQAWLENRVAAAVDDDFYLDRDEEKRIKEEGAAKGISIKDIEFVVRAELDKSGSVCERILLDELERLLHQFTDNDKELDNKEERDALDKVLNAEPGKKKGLDPRVAEEYVNAFCKVNGVKRTSDSKAKQIPIIAVVVVLIAIIIGYSVIKKPNVITKVVNGGAVVQLKDNDRAEIDDYIRRATQYVEKSQYTDPPEKSAKACLDSIKQIDPNGQYKGDEVKAIASKIVGHYISLADKRFAAGDKANTIKWIERAKLLNADMETIREKERTFGLIKKEN
ncbi:MAG: hypothetical protein ACOYL3_10150 [Desulfuromonadaceae bacterium]